MLWNTELESQLCITYDIWDTWQPLSRFYKNSYQKYFMVFHTRLTLLSCESGVSCNTMNCLNQQHATVMAMGVTIYCDITQKKKTVTLCIVELWDISILFIIKLMQFHCVNTSGLSLYNPYSSNIQYYRELAGQVITFFHGEPATLPGIIRTCAVTDILIDLDCNDRHAL